MEVKDATNHCLRPHVGLTDAQLGAVMYAVSSMVGPQPEALAVVRHEGAAVGAPAATFYWIRNGALGCMEVVRPADTDSSAPAMRGWVRPLSRIRRADVEVFTSQDGFNFGFGVTKKLELHWDDDKPAAVLDANGSMDSYARPGLEELIEKVLASVG
ncbi:hypothetical protein WR43_20875 [Mycolicibacter arupensis]|uniref:Uncharacterized protein n=1 Tax=Mycolicibacter arupensis TaxID=342002 RepID=A0A0F5MSK0_9MYCO|nr:hypothetical protein WR43_20875 [Mycolicibacter arupensis]OQZ92004.1 hypothetical protein BST15_19445 [Mycolicibacter arupensis]